MQTSMHAALPTSAGQPIGQERAAGAIRAAVRPAASALPGDRPELREAFTAFVGQTFFGELVRQLRASVPKSPLTHGGFGEDVFQSQLDQVLVERISQASAPRLSEPMYQLLLARRD
jgi:hypothetical protein